MFLKNYEIESNNNKLKDDNYSKIIYIILC